MAQKNTEVTIQRITSMKNKSRCSINSCVQSENFVRKFKWEIWNSRHFKPTDIFGIGVPCVLKEQGEKLDKFAVIDKIMSLDIITMTFSCPYRNLFALLSSIIAFNFIVELHWQLHWSRGTAAAVNAHQSLSWLLLSLNTNIHQNISHKIKICRIWGS
jgi:hypothetical protein